MNTLIKSDVKGLEYQQPGVLVSTDNDAYNNYIQRRKLNESKDSQMKQMQDQINTLNNQLALILSKLDSK